MIVSVCGRRVVWQCYLKHTTHKHMYNIVRQPPSVLHNLSYEWCVSYECVRGSAYKCLTNNSPIYVILCVGCLLAKICVSE